MDKMTRDDKPLISGSQLAVLLCICRLPAILFGLPGDGEEQIWAVLIGEGIRLLTCLPVCAAFAMGWRLPEGILGGIFRFAGAIYLIISLGGLLGELGSFAADTLYPGSSALFFGTALLLLSVYGAHMGLEAAARAALPVLVLFGIGLILTALGVREEIRLIQLRPVEEPANIWRNGIDMGLRPEELLIFLAAGQRTGGSSGRTPAVLWGFGLSAVISALAAFLSGTVLGGLQRSSAYPFFRVETLMSLSIFQRMDAWFMALWVLVIFLRCIFLLWTAEQLLSPYGKNRRLLLPVLGAAALAVLILSRQAGTAGGWAALILYPALALLWLKHIPIRIKRR